MVLLLLIHCLSHFVRALCLVLVFNLLCSTLCPFEFCNYLAEEGWGAGCFGLIVFMIHACDCWCSVTLSHGAAGWSAVCDCGISWP